MVETQRLHIIPLTIEHLERYLLGDGKFEKEFNLTNTQRMVSPEVRERVLQNIIPQLKRVSENKYVFYTFWIVVDKSKKMIVAELGFKGEPSELGEVEIGYGTLHQHRGKHYMTEAVGGMITWARQHPLIKYVLAETHENNLASIKVLQKNNFEPFAQKENMKWWKIFTGTLEDMAPNP